MYTVQAHTLIVGPSITYPSTECAGGEWTDLATISQLETEQAELQEARELKRIAEGYYTRVRIVKSRPDGLLQFVQ